jgi:hypothetical protein
MIPQDEYRGNFYPSTVTDCISAQAIALIKFKLHVVALLHTTPPPMVLVRCNRRSTIPVSAPAYPQRFSVWIGAAIFHSALHSAFSVRTPPLGWALLNPLLNLD